MLVASVDHGKRMIFAVDSVMSAAVARIRNGTKGLLYAAWHALVEKCFVYFTPRI